MALEEQAEDDEGLFEHHSFEVDAGQAPLRIDKYLMDKLSGFSRSRISNACAAGFVLVGGEPVKPNYKVRPLDYIQVMYDQPRQQTELIPQNIPLDIVHEDDEVVVVNKPSGMVVHPGHNNYDGTLVNALIYHFQNLPKRKDETAFPGLVHRIDKDTTGLLLIAKTEAALTYLAKQFFDRTTDRRYLAIAWGDFSEDSGTIEGHIGRSPNNRKIMKVFPEGEHGKPAVTHYKVLERLGYVTLIECKLDTGRTHQIRAHMQHIGHPLFGDQTYGGDKIVKGTTFQKYRQFVDNCFKLLPRQALHAKSIGFTHPVSKAWLSFESALPSDMEQVLDKWRRYTQGATNL